MDVSDILSLLGNVGVADVDFITCEASCKIACVSILHVFYNDN